MSNLQFTHNTEASRYELARDGRLVSVLDYRDNGTAVSLTRAFTVPSERGNGYAAVVTSQAIDELEAAGKKVVPVCWFVGDWFAEHPEKKGMLASA